MPFAKRAVFIAAALAVALASSAFAQSPGGRAGNAAAISPAQTLPPVPPRLARPKLLYFMNHPAEWQKFMSQRPRIYAGPPKARPAASPWQAVAASAPESGLSNPLLLTDGTVLVHVACSQHWYKLTPDINGSYVNGSWSQIAQLPSGYAPLYFASAVLPDGRVIINGGEYNINCNAGAWTTLGAIYNPLANTWAPVSPPSGWATIGDAQSVVLANGTYMLASCCDSPPKAALLNASNLAWTPTGSGKFDVYDEEGWTLLPDATVLTADGYVFTGTCGRNTERYNRATGAWTSAGASPVQLADCSGADENGQPSYEVGPLVLRANGTVVAFSGVATGAVAGTAIFSTSALTWAAGPNLPAVNGQNYDLADAPAAWLPNGNILFAASPGLFSPPTHFFEFSTANTIAQAADTPNAAGEPSYIVNLLVLPTGQVLQTDFSSTAEIYTPSGSPNPAWAPVITSVPSTLVPGQTYQLAGRQLNGLTQGAAYGDDAQSATNFPLVRITNNATGHVFYARTSGFSNLSVAPNASSTANFTVPAGIELGASTLVAVANGIPSAPANVTISANTVGSLLVTPSLNISASGTQYGPFKPAAFQYQLSATAGSLAYSITLPSWLRALPASGTVTTLPTTVTVSYSNNSINLTPGTYAGNISFTNTTNGQGNTSLSAVLTVSPLVWGFGGH